MSDQLPANSKTEDVFRIPRDTAPTWEVELLISAASFFSLLQLPALLDQGFTQSIAYMGAQFNYMLTLGYVYAKVITYILLITFFSHLVLRAAWVGTLGLRSIYPDGINWDALRVGPIYKDYIKRFKINLHDAVERDDNAASITFSFGVLIAILSATVMVLSVLIAYVDIAVSWLFFDGDAPWWTALLWLSIFLLPIIGLSAVDRFAGARIAPGSRMAKAIELTYLFWHYIALGGLLNPMILTLSSRIGRYRFNILFILGLYLLMGVVMLQLQLRMGSVDFSPADRLFANAGSNELKSQHYASTRNETTRFRTAPFISDPVVAGRYLRLTVPYDEKAMGEPLSKKCPDLVKAVPDDAAKERHSEQLLACISALYAVRIDGDPVAARFDVATDPATGLRGFATFIDVHSLSRGRHLLQLNQPRPPETDPDEKAEDDAGVNIPFYR